MTEYQELRAALGIPEGASHERALEIARHLAPDTEDDPIPECLRTIAFHAAWLEWELHRRERRLPKYKPRSKSALLSKLAEMGSIRAAKAIHFSIAQNYQGIYEDRQGSSAANPRAVNVIGTADRYKIGPGVHGGQRTQVSEGI